MKVLLLGMKKADNQFTRGLDQYAGLSYDHLDSSYRGEIPTCDVAILATCQMGQSQLNHAKQHFKATGTPFIVGGQSFSRIKDQLDQIIASKGFAPLPQQQPNVLRMPDQKIRSHTTSMGAALKTAKVETRYVREPKPMPKFNVFPSHESWKETKNAMFKEFPAIGAMFGTFEYGGQAEENIVQIATKEENRHIVENIDKDHKAQAVLLEFVQRHMGRSIKGVARIILSKKSISGFELGELFEEWTERGLSVDQSIELLKKSNMVKPSGKEWTQSDLYQARSIYRKKLQKQAAEREQAEFNEKIKPPQPEPEPTPMPPVPAPTPVVTALPPLPESLKSKLPTPPAPPRPPSTPEELRVRDELIGKVLAMKDFDALKKLELIEEINAGVRTVEHQVIPELKDGKLQLTAQSIFHPEDKALLVMDKALARDIVSVMEAIKKYAEEV